MCLPRSPSLKESTLSTAPKKLMSWLIPTIIVGMAVTLIVLTSGGWEAWAGQRINQTTDDASVRADLTPLSTKAAGLVASVEVNDYQSVRAGDLLVRLRDDDFQAQVQQAAASLTASESAIGNNQRQKELQDARIA